MNLRARAITGIKWQVIDIVGRQIVSFAVYAVLARTLNPGAFGLISLVVVYLAFIGMFVDQGISTALVQRKELTADHLDAAYWYNLAMASVLFAASLLAATPVSGFLGEPALAPLIRCLSLTIIINSFATVPNAIFVREMNFRTPAYSAAISSIAGGVVGVTLALRGFGVWSLAFQQLTAAVSAAAFTAIASSWRPSLRFSFARLRDLLGIGTSVFGSAMIWFLVSKIDQLVLGRYAGADVVGYYTMGNKVPELVKTLIHQPLSLISLTSLAKMQGDRARMNAALTQAMGFNTVLTFPVFVGLAAVAPTFLPLAFGDAWKPAVLYMQLWSLYACVLSLFIYPGPAILATGGAGRYLYLGALSAIGSFVASLVGVRFGPVAILLGLISNILLTGIISLLFLRHRTGMSPFDYLRPACKPAIASLIMGISVYAIPFQLPGLPAPIVLSAQVLIGIAVYVGFMWIISRERITQFWQLIFAMVRPVGRLPAV